MKKILAIAGTALIMMTFTASIATAAPQYNVNANAGTSTFARGFGCWGGRALMYDDKGNFLSKADFEKKLDTMVAAGEITADEKAAYLTMYDFCVTNRGNATGGRFGGCGGRGRMRFN